MSRVLGAVRVVLVAFAVVTAWPVLAALAARAITWDQAVDLLVNTKGITLTLVVLVLCVAISLTRSAPARFVAAVAVCACLVAVLTGAASPTALWGGARSASEAARVAGSCGWTTAVEGTGSNLRTVLKDPDQGGAVVGYVLSNGGQALARALDGSPLAPRCAA